MIPQRIESFLDRHHLRPARLVMACSGGVDSTALLLSFLDVSGVDITCAHVNHHLRGADSDEDEAFVRTLCATHAVPFVAADGTLDADRIRRSGVEAAAREIREARLREIAASVCADYIATAHQKNDQAETVLMRVMTGSGLGGLRGVHPVRDDGFIRPLLEITRAQIEEFLESRGVQPRIDRSNSDPRFLRNRVRALLRELGDSAVESLAAMAEQAQQLWPVLQRSIDGIDRACTRASAVETEFVTWPDEAWSRQALLHRHIHRLGDARDVSSRDLERLAASVDSIQRVSVTRELEIIRRGDTLVLRRRPDPVEEFELTIDAAREVFVSQAGVSLSVRRTAWRDPRSDDRSRQLIQLPDGAEARFTVRNRRRGDRFHPLGLQHDKKLKDFLNDRKIAPEVRDRIPLLIWNGTIVLIAGVEVSDLFKVTSPGGELYEVTVEDESHHQQNQAGNHR